MRKERQPITLSDEQRKFINTIPDRYRKVTIKAMQGESKAASVKAKCLDYCAFEREEIRNCQCQVTCPLWVYRPYRIKMAKSTRSL